MDRDYADYLAYLIVGAILVIHKIVDKLFIQSRVRHHIVIPGKWQTEVTFLTTWSSLVAAIAVLMLGALTTLVLWIFKRGAFNYLLIYVWAFTAPIALVFGALFRMSPARHWRHLIVSPAGVQIVDRDGLSYLDLPIQSIAATRIGRKIAPSNQPDPTSRNLDNMVYRCLELTVKPGAPGQYRHIIGAWKRLTGIDGNSILISDAFQADLRIINKQIQYHMQLAQHSQNSNEKE